MRRDENDACGAIPRTREEWPILFDEQIWRESHMPRVDKVPDANQMSRIWNYVPPRAGRSRFQESRHQASQSSRSQPSRALQSREQEHWRRQLNTNAGWGAAIPAGKDRHSTAVAPAVQGGPSIENDYGRRRVARQETAYGRARSSRRRLASLAAPAAAGAPASGVASSTSPFHQTVQSVAE